MDKPFKNQLRGVSSVISVLALLHHMATLKLKGIGSDNWFLNSIAWKDFLTVKASMIPVPNTALTRVAGAYIYWGILHTISPVSLRYLFQSLVKYVVNFNSTLWIEKNVWNGRGP